jgi:hypothetical protein
MAVGATRAAFRLHGPSAAEVTRRLGLEPSWAAEVGEPSGGRTNRHPRDVATWSLRSTLPETDPLGAHLASLTDLLDADAVRALVAEGYDADWFCFVSGDESGQLPFDLPYGVVARLAAYPADLLLDVYG